MGEGKDAGIVAIRPGKLKRVATDGIDTPGRDILGNFGIIENLFTSPFIDTMGAAAVQTNPPDIQDGIVAITPHDSKGMRSKLPELLCVEIHYCHWRLRPPGVLDRRLSLDSSAATSPASFR